MMSVGFGEIDTGLSLPTVATVIAKAALAEQELISSSSCNMRLTRATSISGVS